MKDVNQDQLLMVITEQLNEASNLPSDEYRALLEEIMGDCEDRIDGLDTDEADDEG